MIDMYIVSTEILSRYDEILAKKREQFTKYKSEEHRSAMLKLVNRHIKSLTNVCDTIHNLYEGLENRSEWEELLPYEKTYLRRSSIFLSKIRRVRGRYVDLSNDLMPSLLHESDIYTVSNLWTVYSGPYLNDRYTITIDADNIS